MGSGFTQLLAPVSLFLRFKLNLSLVTKIFKITSKEKLKLDYKVIKLKSSKEKFRKEKKNENII